MALLCHLIINEKHKQVKCERKTSIYFVLQVGN